MVRFRVFFRSLGVPVITIAILFALVLGIGAVARKSANGQGTRSGGLQIQAEAQVEPMPTCQSLAHGLTIASITGTQREGYQVTLRNEYSQSIVAFQIGVRRGRMTRDLLYHSQGILPGASRTEYHAYEPAMATHPLTIFGVVFEDGSGDGQPHAVKAIKDMRLGAKMQLTQFVPILGQSLTLAKAGSSRIILDTLQSKINSLPDPAEELPPYVKFGLHNEKQRLLSEVQRMRDGVSPQLIEGDHLEKELLKLKRNNEARAVKLTNRLIQ